MFWILPLAGALAWASSALPHGWTQRAGDAEEAFYRAFYEETELGDPAAAIASYERALAGGALPGELAAQAAERLAGCREELRSADLLGLMPLEPWLVVELDRPAEHAGRLLERLGLVAGEGEAGGAARLAFDPELLAALGELRGVALAVTGFNPATQAPNGVLVAHLGDLELVRGFLRTALPAAVAEVETIEGFPMWQLEDKAWITLTRRLVVVGTQRAEVRRVLQRLADAEQPALTQNAKVVQALRGAGAARPLVSFAIDPKPMLPLVALASSAAPAGVRREVEFARALLDPEHLAVVCGRLSVEADGLALDLALGLEGEHQNLVFNLLRTPKLEAQTLARIPAEAAGFLALAVNAFDPGRAAASEPRVVTGLDLGRELFANLAAVALFALPPDAATGASGFPDIAAVLTVHDPAKSEALWSLGLGLASLAGGGSALEGQPSQIAGHAVRTWTFPAGPALHLAVLERELAVATTPRALERLLAGAGSAPSVLDDPAYAAVLGELSGGANQVLCVEPGRLLRVLRPFLSERERAELDPLGELCRETVVGVFVQHEPDQLALRARVAGLPAIDALLDEALRRRLVERSAPHDHAHGMRPEMVSAAAAASPAAPAPAPEPATVDLR